MAHLTGGLRGGADNPDDKEPAFALIKREGAPDDENPMEVNNCAFGAMKEMYNKKLIEEEHVGP